MITKLLQYIGMYEPFLDLNVSFASASTEPQLGWSLVGRDRFPTSLNTPRHGIASLLDSKMVAIVKMIKLAAPHACAGAKVDAVAVRSAQVFRTLILLLVLIASVLCGSALVSVLDGCRVPTLLAEACRQLHWYHRCSWFLHSQTGCPR